MNESSAAAERLPASGTAMTSGRRFDRTSAWACAWLMVGLLLGCHHGAAGGDAATAPSSSDKPAPNAADSEAAAASPSPAPPPEAAPSGQARLSDEELAQLKALQVATETLGTEFPDCHQGLQLSRWGGRITGRHQIPTEEELEKLEALKRDLDTRGARNDAEVLSSKLARGYVELVFSIRRDLLVEYYRGSPFDAVRIRGLLGRKESAERKMLEYLQEASLEGRKDGAQIRHELAVQLLMLQDYPAARRTAEAMPSSANQADLERTALMIGLTYLPAPAAVEDLKQSERILAPIAQARDPSPSSLVARCLVAEIHARQGRRTQALMEWRALRDQRATTALPTVDDLGVWRTAERRIQELEASAP